MGFSAGLGPLAVQPPRASAPPKSDDELLEESLPTLHLAGNATVMLRTAQRLGVAAVAVVLMVHEGDNLRDGVAMAAHTDALLHLFPSTAPAAASATSTGAGGAAGAGADAGAGAGVGAGAGAGESVLEESVEAADSAEVEFTAVVFPVGAAASAAASGAGAGAGAAFGSDIVKTERQQPTQCSKVK